MASEWMAQHLPRRLTLEFLRYFAASAAGLGLDFSLYVGLTELAGWHYLLSGAIGFCAGAMAVYALSSGWGFRERRVRDSRWELFVFVSIGVLGLLLTELVLYVFTDFFGVDYRLSKIFAAGAVFLINFGLRRHILFRSSPA